MNDAARPSRLAPRVLVPALLTWAFLPGLVIALLHLLGVHTVEGYPTGTGTGSVFDFAAPAESMPVLDVFLGVTLRGWMLGLEPGLLLLLPWLLLRARPQPGHRAAEAVKFMLLEILVSSLWFLLKVAASGQLLAVPLDGLAAQLVTTDTAVGMLAYCSTTWMTGWLLAYGERPVLRAPLQRPLSGAPLLPLALRALLVGGGYFLVAGLLATHRMGWPVDAAMPQAASRFGLQLLTVTASFALAVVACARFRARAPGSVDWDLRRAAAALLVHAALFWPFLLWAFYQRQIEGPVEPAPLTSFWSLPGVLTTAVQSVPPMMALFAVLTLPRTAPRDSQPVAA